MTNRNLGRRGLRRGAWLAAPLLGLGLAGLAPQPGRADDQEKPYHIAADGTVDWYTYNGYRRYHSDCHVCHGPDGLGSSFGPALVDSLKVLTREQFLDTVANGKQDVSNSQFKKMPAFGLNPNVMCYIDDIYAYLKARSDGAIGRGPPEKIAPKPQAAKDRDTSCMPSTD
jgi:methanol metabolism-related c-type cytochrome